MIKTIDNDLLPLFISFSGGETSGMMLIKLWEKYKGKRRIIVLFANTGEENEETLVFVHTLQNHYGIEVIWVEAVINVGYWINGRKWVINSLDWIRIRRKLKRKLGEAKAAEYVNGLKSFTTGVRHKVTNFYEASRHSQPFRAMIAKHGIPNMNSPFCTRELKTRAMEHYLKVNGYPKYHTAVGIRADEPTRLKKLYYPLALEGITKPHVNEFWSKQPFRLRLKGYQGNCKACWKKSKRKQLTIAAEKPEAFNFACEMEEKYGNYVPKQRLEKQLKEGKTINYPITFFRDNRSAKGILQDAKTFTDFAADDAVNINIQEAFNFDMPEVARIKELVAEGVEPDKAVKQALNEFYNNIDEEDFGGCGSESCEPF